MREHFYKRTAQRELIMSKFLDVLRSVLTTVTGDFRYYQEINGVELNRVMRFLLYGIVLSWIGILIVPTVKWLSDTDVTNHLYNASFIMKKNNTIIAFHDIAAENLQAVSDEARARGYGFYAGPFDEPFGIWCDANGGHFNGGNGITQISCETDEKGVISDSQIIEEGSPSVYAGNLLSHILKDMNTGR